ncbi:MAG: hypothetical protein R2747_16250 [Pyrinomonadaceae bacterium]
MWLRNEEKKSPCRVINVAGPTEIVTAGKEQIFTATLIGEEKYQFEYNWTVEGGKIIEGQGTTVIKVVQPPELAGANLVAIVTTKSFPAGCDLIGSETALICDCVDPLQIDEVSGSLADVKKENLDNLAKYLAEDPSARGVLIWEFSKPVFERNFKPEERRITEYLTKEKNIPKERIIIKAFRSDNNVVRFWYLSPGAKIPTP